MFAGGSACECLYVLIAEEGVYLSGIESINAMIPRSLHAFLHNVPLLSAAIGEPSTCEGCQSRRHHLNYGLIIPREKIETLRPVGPR